MTAHTPGPWQVIITEHPHHLGGKHIQRRIATVWEHGQLKAPCPVVNLSVGLGEVEGGAPIHMVSIREEDACLIAAAPELLEALREIVGKFDAAPANVKDVPLGIMKARKAIAAATQQEQTS